MSRFSILLGGDITPTDRLTNQVSGSLVIAADSGIKHAKHFDKEPELWVGDFDSASANLQEQYAEVAKLPFPVDKDMTDGEIAIDAALERGASSIILVGAFGGARSDHAFTHFSLALKLAERGVEVILTDGRQEGYPLTSTSKEFDFRKGTMFSILPFEDLRKLTLSGAKWPLDNIDLKFGSSLTMSNEVAGKLTARVESGRAILLAHT